MAPASATSLLLVGAGHAHLHLLQQGRRLKDAGYAVSLLAPAEFRYSGVATASATGALPTEVGVIDVAALAQRQSITHHPGRLSELDLEGRRARTDAGVWLDFDLVSFNIGSVAAQHGIDLAQDVLSVKPLDVLADLDRRVRAAVEALSQAPRNAKITIVGGGPSGLELAGNLACRSDLDVNVIEGAPTILPQLSVSARRRISRLLSERGVRLHTDVAVARIELDRVVLSDGRTLAHDVAVLATGLISPPLLEDVGLVDPGCSADGIPVRNTLQHRDHDDVYAVGDCAYFTPKPLPRIGVYGVRQGPVLLASLLARARNKPLPHFVPQRRALQVLDLGGGIGLAIRGRWWWLGKSSLRLKRSIDHTWLAGYR